MTFRSWQRRRANHRTWRGRALEPLEPRILLSISPTGSGNDSNATSFAASGFNQFDSSQVLQVAKQETGQSPLVDVGTAGLTTNEILDPAPFEWTYVSSPEPHYVGVLEYGEATFDISGDTLTTRAYRQQGAAYSIPGPTLNMVPGNKYVLRFRNLLPYEAPSPDMNVFKDPNITNVHTHGLHISGESPGDDVTRMFEGGFNGDYVYDIPADHMGGTFWYHAHHHGSTFLQVTTGGFGFIIIDDSQDQIPANVAAMEERQILIGYLDPAAAGTGGDTIVAGTFQPGWTVNGAVNSDLVMPPDTWQHWRVLLADTDARTKDVTVGTNCETKLLARDGVWRTSAPKDLPTRTINLTGASRADLAVRCSGNSDIRVDNTTVANIVINGTADPGPHPFAADGVSVWSAARPEYLRDLRAETEVHIEDISMGARTINGEKFDHDVALFTLNTDAVQEWSIQGGTNHPFHLHVYHFQALLDSGDFEAGEYYDTIAANGPVRFDLNAATSSPFAGRTIFHCHILEHEDRGAMAWADVVGGSPAPVFPSGQGYSEYYAAIPGDFDTDGDLDVNDIDLLIAEIAGGNNTPFYDLTDDGQVDLDDRDAWLEIAGAANLPSGNSYLLGDANLDGTVDREDFLVWNDNKFTSVAAWSAGDFNADGFVDGRDLLIWNENKFTSSDRIMRSKSIAIGSRETREDPDENNQHQLAIDALFSEHPLLTLTPTGR